MTLFYRLLGMVARLSERLSHMRINFIPLNLLAIAGLAALFALGVTETRDAVVNGTKPRATRISEVLDHRDVDHNYVTVKGLLLPSAGFTKVEEDKYSKNQKVEASYIFLIDVEGKRILLVERKGEVTEGEPVETQVTGMLIPMESELRSKLMEKEGKIDNVPVDTQYMLVEGKQPGNASLYATLMTVSGVFLLLFLVTFFSRYVVFQKTRSVSSTGAMMPSNVSLEQGIDLRVTGKFVLDEKNANRFLNVPARLVTLTTGEIGLVSNIDASSRFFGVTTSERKGLWAIILQPGSLSRLETGYLYDGFAARPAFRIRYNDGPSQGAGSAILSFASETERGIMLGELNKLAGYSLPHTGVS